MSDLTLAPRSDPGSPGSLTLASGFPSFHFIVANHRSAKVNIAALEALKCDFS